MAKIAGLEIDGEPMNYVCIGEIVNTGRATLGVLATPILSADLRQASDEVAVRVIRMIDPEASWGKLARVTRGDNNAVIFSLEARNNTAAERDPDLEEHVTKRVTARLRANFPDEVFLPMLD